MKTDATAMSYAQQLADGSKPVEQQFRVHKFQDGEEIIALQPARLLQNLANTLGNGSIHYATRTIEIDKPALIFSNPRVPYSYETENVRGGYMCIFKEDFLKVNGRDESLQDSPLFRIGSNPVFFLDESRLALISSMYERMLEEFDTHYIHRLDVIRHYVNLIIHEAMKMEPALHAIKYHNAAERIAGLFLELLERQFPIDSPEHALKFRKPADFAESLSVHVNHLNHAVREITGKSTSEHIAERMILEAKALLRHTDYSISDIAYCLGFDYPNYFNSFFKKNTGVTPLSVRK